MEDPKVIRAWFDRIQRAICSFGIDQDDIWNFDETGFVMGLTSTAKVVTRAEYYGRRSKVQPGNREWVTAVETINSSGYALPPTIIFKAKLYNSAWFSPQIPYPNDWRIEVSDNGWTTDEISLRWLQEHFIPLTNHRTKGKWRLLILDGHGSHITAEFDDICMQNCILPVCMPAHSSHLLQPLDVGCFAIIKRAYGQYVQKLMCHGVNHIDKLDFLSNYPLARAEAYNKPSIIQNAFAGAGLFPFDAQQVLEKLNIDLDTPTPPASRRGGFDSWQ
jgi:hypothetical protein